MFHSYNSYFQFFISSYSLYNTKSISWKSQFCQFSGHTFFFYSLAPSSTSPLWFLWVISFPEVFSLLCFCLPFFLCSHCSASPASPHFSVSPLHQPQEIKNPLFFIFKSNAVLLISLSQASHNL